MNEKTMQLDTKAGQRVRYANPESSYPSDIFHAKQHLKLGKIYIVSKTVIHDWSTEVFLEGFDYSFNHAHFTEVDDNAVDVEIESKPLPEKLQALITDTDNVFLCRIGTDPRSTQTGIVNVICQGLSRDEKDYVIAITKHIVDCWNNRSKRCD